MSKSIITFVVLTTMAITPVMAQELTSVESTKNPEELSNLFITQNENIQALELSNQEMKSTQGAFAPWVIGGAIGGLSGGAMYSYGAWKGNYQWNTNRFLGNVATGAVIGGTFGAAGAAAGGGMSIGANIWRVNSFSANFGANHIWRH